MNYYEATVKFDSQNQADIFARWLTKNNKNHKYGYPILIKEYRATYCTDAKVEFSAKSGYALGVAAGISLCHGRL